MPNKFIAPPIELPFESQRSVHADTFERVSLEWAEGAGLIRSAEERKRWREIELGDLTARSYAGADIARGTLLACWIGWTAFVEAFSDKALDLGSEIFTEIHRLCRQVLGPASAEESRRTPLDSALGWLWQRTAPAMSPVWRDRCAGNLLDYVHASFQEAAAVSAGEVPTLEEYMEQRQRTIASYAYFDLVEFGVDGEIPKKIRDGAAYREIRQCANEITFLINDVGSAAKEVHAGDYHNYVILLAHLRGNTLAEAAAETVRRIDSAGDRFLRLEADLVSGRDYETLGDGDQEKVRRTLDGLKTFMAGERDWHLTSRRYQVAQHQD